MSTTREHVEHSAADLAANTIEQERQRYEAAGPFGPAQRAALTLSQDDAIAKLARAILTRAAALDQIRRLGMVATYNSALQEFRIDYPRHDARRTNSTAYFTDDAGDAMATAYAMSREGLAVVTVAPDATPAQLTISRLTHEVAQLQEERADLLAALRAARTNVWRLHRAIEDRDNPVPALDARLVEIR